MQTPIVLLLRSSPREAEVLGYKPLLGVPLFLRGLLTMADAGYTQFAMIAPAHARRHILKTWQKLAAGRGLQLELITCRPELRLTQETIATLRKTVAPRFVLMDANTLVTTQWVKEHLRPALTHGRPLTGPGRILTARELQVWQGTVPADGIRVDQLLAASPSNDTHYHTVEHRSGFRTAERFLCEQIRRAATGLVARHLNKRISLPISRPLARLRVHPHVITAFNMLVGLAAGIGTAGVTYWGLLVGAFLFQLASVLDGCDGEVAKLTFRTSKFGQYIDTVSDNFALVSFITGLVIHQYRTVSTASAIVCAALLLSGLTVLLSIMIRFLRTTNSASLVTFEVEYLGRLTRHSNTWLAAFARGGKLLLKKDCFSLVAFAFALCGILPVWLYSAGAFVWIGVGTILLLRWQHAGAPLPQSMTANAPLATRKNANARS